MGIELDYLQCLVAEYLVAENATYEIKGTDPFTLFY
jgi:hypothetical protein